MESNRRNFLRNSFATASGLVATTMLPTDLFGQGSTNMYNVKEIILQQEKRPAPKDSIRFSVIGINHSHIYGMVTSLTAGGGQLVAVYSKEPELLPDFTKRFQTSKWPKVKLKSLMTNPFSWWPVLPFLLTGHRLASGS